MGDVLEKNDRELLKRMLDTSEQYLAACEILEGKLAYTGPASPVLGVLAFEISLKALYRAHLNVRPGFRHKYVAGFAELPANVQQDVLERASSIGGGLGLTLEKALKVCSALTHCFLNGRYEYEIFEEKGERKYYSDLKKWVNNGLQDEDADFKYYPEERRALTLAMNELSEEWLSVEVL